MNQLSVCRVSRDSIVSDRLRRNAARIWNWKSAFVRSRFLMPLQEWYLFLNYEDSGLWDLERVGTIHWNDLTPSGIIHYDLKRASIVVGNHEMNDDSSPLAAKKQQQDNSPAETTKLERFYEKYGIGRQADADVGSASTADEPASTTRPSA
jgi:hypothetical protein